MDSKDSVQIRNVFPPQIIYDLLRNWENAEPRHITNHFLLSNAWSTVYNFDYTDTLFVK